MKDTREELKASQLPLSIGAFLESYNENIPASFPRASVELLKKFKEANGGLFKQGDSWSPYVHRKKLMDWLVQNKI